MTSANRLTLAAPLDGADVPVAELATTTRNAEARAVMATIAGLRDQGVAVRDIAVVARDLDQCEQPLARGAIQYGITPVFWTQLRVTQTRPYALIESVCEVLGAEQLTRETLCEPLEHRWCPQSATSPTWPIDPQQVQAWVQLLPDGSRTLEEWHAAVEATPAIDARLVTYIEWLIDCPAPTPDAVTAVLTGVVERYEEHGLPETKANESATHSETKPDTAAAIPSPLIETEQDARAVVRVHTLVQQLRIKYADRLEEGTRERSWAAVAAVSQLIATQRPGRREHSNARAIDIFEANDVWFVDVPYVIAVGLVDDEWPTQTATAVPPELQEAILSGDGRLGTLAPRTAWTSGRDRDQFDDTVRAAGAGLIVTRHTETVAGEERRPSPLLEYLDTDVVPTDEQRRLVSPDRRLPAAVQAMVDPEVTDSE